MRSTCTVLTLRPAGGLSNTFHWVIIRRDLNNGKELDSFYTRRGVTCEQLAAFQHLPWAKDFDYNILDCMAVTLGEFFEVKKSKGWYV